MRSVLEFTLCPLKGINEFEARWIGWAGVNVPDEVGQRSLTKALAEKVRKLFGSMSMSHRFLELCIFLLQILCYIIIRMNYVEWD